MFGALLQIVGVQRARGDGEAVWQGRDSPEVGFEAKGSSEDEASAQGFVGCEAGEPLRSWHCGVCGSGGCRRGSVGVGVEFIDWRPQQNKRTHHRPQTVDHNNPAKSKLAYNAATQSAHAPRSNNHPTRATTTHHEGRWRSMGRSTSDMVNEYVSAQRKTPKK